MRALFPIPALLLSLFALAAWSGAADDKSPPPFRPAPASAWPSHLTIGGITFAAVRYESDVDTRPLFNKVNLSQYGVLPVLLIIDNKSDQNLLLDLLHVEFDAAGGIRLNPTPPADLPYLIAPKNPMSRPSLPSPIPLPHKKGNALSQIEIETRAWGAKSLMPGESTHGFFYFQTEWGRSAYITISGIREARTQKEVFFAEVPMDSPGDAQPPAAPAPR
ncbi:MAG: hypothetical protein ACLQBJ_16680 [Bryobacteraceae bacterium]